MNDKVKSKVLLGAFGLCWFVEGWLVNVLVTDIKDRIRGKKAVKELKEQAAKLHEEQQEARLAYIESRLDEIESQQQKKKS